MKVSALDLDTLVRTVWGEARGEPELGQAAVIGVIINRWKDPRWPETIIGVCWQPKQFSCWNNNDPNRKLIERLDVLSKDYQRLYYLAVQQLVGIASDPTRGANHYHATTMKKKPKWASANQFVLVLGRHAFYKL